MEEEIECLKHNNTWQLHNLLHSCKAIKCKWVYLTKPDMQGNVTHHHACLVAKGFSQTTGVNYKDTFTPVARLNSLCLLLAIVAQSDLDVHHIDIKSAYLNGDLDEEIYMVSGDHLQFPFSSPYLLCVILYTLFLPFNCPFPYCSYPFPYLHTPLLGLAYVMVSSSYYSCALSKESLALSLWISSPRPCVIFHGLVVLPLQ